MNVNADSFFFLSCRELAEMLGHVKPPTVTKEEIDKSGLETIKPAMLSAYEAKGKIASSCTERVCLSHLFLIITLPTRFYIHFHFSLYIRILPRNIN